MFFLFVLFILLAGGYVLLQHKGIQNRLTTHIMELVSEELGTPFTVGSVDLAFPYRLRLRNICLEDQYGDTLLYAKSATAGVSRINPVKKVIRVNAVNLNEAYFRLSSDSADVLNIDFVLERIRKKDGSGKPGWSVVFNNIKLKNSRFRLQLYPFEAKRWGINFTDLRLSDINASLHHFRPGKDSTTFLIRSLNFREASGFRVTGFNADFRMCSQFLKFLDLEIKTPVSDLRGYGVQLLFDSFQDFAAGGVYEKVTLLTDLKDANLNLADLGYFAPVFRETDQTVRYSGRTKGTVGNLKVKDISIQFGNNSLIQGSLNISGLPDFKETFIFADFREFRTSVADAATFRLPGGKTIRMPERLGRLGTISYQGKFTGFIDDFVAFGTFRTGLGVLSSDLLFRPDTSNYFSFTGKINARDFDLGSFLDMKESIGLITMSVTAGGCLSERYLKANLKGEVNSFFMKGYQYRNIQLAGTILNKTYNGSLFINDPNINLDFHGRVDFERETGAYDFSANVTRANLYALNIDKTDPLFNVSFYVQANATGRSLAELNGEVRLLNSLFEKKDKQLQVYDFSLQSRSQPGQQSLRLRSDFLEGDLTGDYDLTKIKPFFLHLLHTYFPSLADTAGLGDYRFGNSFDLSLSFKNTRPVFDFFMPDYYVDESTLLKASFDATTREASLFCNSPLVKIKNLAWNDYHLYLKGDTSLLSIESGGLSMTINDRIELDNFTMASRANRDTVDFMARWNNWDELSYRGSLKAGLHLSKPPGSAHPLMQLTILPTTIITYDTVWNVNRCEVLIDSNHITVDNFQVDHNRESLRLTGTVSQNPDDRIEFEFRNFNLGNLNLANNAKQFQLECILNGDASFSNLYDNPLVVSNLGIDSLIVNGEKLGTANILSAWNNRKKSLEIEANAMREKLKTILIEGSYFLNTRKLDFTVKLDKLRLNPFNPYLDNLFDDLRGMASGNLDLKGTIDKPVLNGEINLQKAAFTIDYLQSRYNFSERARIINNNIYFRNLRVYDGFGNQALITGNLRTRYLRDLAFDISIQADNLQFLNTKSTDNRMFYGTAFATGLVTIEGSPSSVNMNITAKTEKHTVFSIPLSSDEELTEYNFVKVFGEDAQTDEVVLRNDYKVDLSGIRMNFDLEVTPDAEVQIIFDPKVGDILSGSGTGNLNMKISTSGNFVMFGDFSIDKGDYLLTVQNVFNKRFTIEPGGQIRWNGDPFDATLDLLAKYRTKASLSELFGSEEEKYKSKIPVDCQLFLTGKLMSPNVRFDIDLPQSEEETKISMKNKISTTEEIDKQVISLLMLNSFYFNPSGSSGSGETFSAAPYSNAAGTTVSELLSNQLSNWLSQINNDLDIGINYRSDTRDRGEEVELMLGTQLFNDRLTINGSVDVATNATANASSNIVGEFDIDYKLTKNGRLRVKTYNHINNDLLYENSPYTQGLGFTYREEFNTFGELLRRYWNAISGKKEENKMPSRPESNKGG